MTGNEDASAYIVVGGGPTAVATARALCQHGLRVVVVDTGLQLEDEKLAVRERLSSVLPEQWSPSDLASIRYQPSNKRLGLAGKQLFGSDIAFRDDGVDNMVIDPSVGTSSSFAIGGLSTVWGAGLLTYTASDVANWPVGHDVLDAHAKEVLSFLPYAASADQLAKRYPMLADSAGHLKRSAVGEQILARFTQHERSLAASGLSFGGARLAVRTGEPAPANGCIYCGRCLDGCPYGHIYNAASTISELRDEQLIEYRGGLHVQSVREQETGVVLEALTLDTHRPTEIVGRRVFLAAGALSTTLILQRSQFLPPRVTLHDSQTHYMPFLWSGKGRTGAEEAGYSLAQAFAVLEDPKVSTHPIHLSLYTANEHLVSRARDLHPAISRHLGGSLDRAFRRLVVAISFLHSDDSHSLELSWRQRDNSARLSAVTNRETKHVIGQLHRSLLQKTPLTGLLPLSVFAESSRVGGGHHYGASMPMATTPVRGECDLLGRPLGARFVHAVDATCFPSIPAGMIALPAMANAHRIASEVASGDRG